MRSTIGTILVISLAGGSTLAAQQSTTPPTWEITLGAGALTSPSYPGSDEHKFFPLPLTQVTWRNRVYLGQSTAGNGPGLGAYAVRTAHLGLAAEVGMLQDRPTSRADALAGMDNRTFVATASGTVSYRVGPVEAAVSATQGLNDGAGLLGTARLGYTQTVGSRFIAAINFTATFANARQMRWDFGVTDAEASRRQALIASGDDRLHADEGGTYRPDAGLRQTGTSLSLTYLVTRHWAVVAFGSAEELSKAAAKSPLVRQREQLTGGFGVGYRF